MTGIGVCFALTFVWVVLMIGIARRSDASSLVVTLVWIFFLSCTLLYCYPRPSWSLRSCVAHCGCSVDNSSGGQG